ncbi:MAG TPA: hypothetical protein VF234_09635, partial [Limnochordia bacterium]
GSEVEPPLGSTHDVELSAWRLFERLLVMEEFERFEQALVLVDRFGFEAGRSQLHLGRLLYRRGFLEHAVEPLLGALQAGVRDLWLFRTLGVLLARRGAAADARALFDAALSLDPDELRLHLLCADELARAGDPLGARHILTRARQRWPGATEVARRLERLTAPA